MPRIAVVVECQAAASAKCYARDLVTVAEEMRVPLTWLLAVSRRDPLSNVDLYYREYMHRIPAWHEIGVRLDVNGDCSDPRGRADLFRLGREMLKQCHVKPVSCKVHGAKILGDDVRALADAGFVVAMGEMEGQAEVSSGLGGTPVEYASENGGPALILLPQCGLDCTRGPEAVAEAVGEHHDDGEVIVFTCRDDREDADALREAISVVRRAKAAIHTLTAAALG